MTTKSNRVLTYNEELPTIKLDDPSITWFFEVTRGNKDYFSPLALDQWQLNMTRW